MRWLVTGARGQVGRDVVARLVPAPGDRGATISDVVLALGRAELDVTDPGAVDAAVADFAPDVVVNLAAFTAVDAAESDEGGAYATNAVGPAVVAGALARRGGRLVHLSTDYVFDGTAAEPYEVGAATSPRSAYGRTKRAGEGAVLAALPQAGYVVRTAWVYGAGGPNFVKTMARLERQKDTLDVVDDQHGSPTWSVDLADGILELARARPPAGIYHCTNAGSTTWFGLARAVFEELGADPGRVRPVGSGAIVRAAPRPAYSVLAADGWVRAGLRARPHWRSGLREAFVVDGDRLRAG